MICWSGSGLQAGELKSRDLDLLRLAYTWSKWCGCSVCYFFHFNVHVIANFSNKFISQLIPLLYDVEIIYVFITFWYTLELCSWTEQTMQSIFLWLSPLSFIRCTKVEVGYIFQCLWSLFNTAHNFTYIDEFYARKFSCMEFPHKHIYYCME